MVVHSGAGSLAALPAAAIGPDQDFAVIFADAGLPSMAFAVNRPARLSLGA